MCASAFGTLMPADDAHRGGGGWRRRLGGLALLCLPLAAAGADAARPVLALPASSSELAGGRERALAARSLSLPPPRVNAWGGARYQVEALPAAGGRAAAQRFRVDERGQGDAQLAWQLPLRRGQAYQAELTLRAGAPVEVDVLLRRDAPPWDPYAIRTLRLDRRAQSVSLQGWALSDAPASLRVVARTPGVDVFVERATAREIAGAVLGPALKQPIPADFFGVHLMRLGQHANWPAYGPGMVRLWDTRTTWKDLKPEPGPWDFGNPAGRRLDLYVNHVRRMSPSTGLLYVLGQTPRWASSDPEAPNPYGKGHSAPPKDLDDWRDYVRTLARRYAGRIRDWELWNEPDYAMFYRGSPEQMVEMARIAREELKAADPQNRLVSPGLTQSQGLQWLHRFLAAGGGRHVDAIAFHWYYNLQPEGLVAPIGNVRQVMRQHGVGDKPLWNTEGAPICDPKMRDCAAPPSEAEQRGVNARALLIMWASGVSRFDYYFWEGRAPGEAQLERDFRTPTLAGRSYAEAVRWLRGARLLDAWRVGETVYVMRLQRGDRPFTIAWALDPGTEVRLPPAWGSTRLRRLDGSAARLEPDEALTLGLEPVLLE